MLIPFKELWTRYKIQTPGVLHLGANTGQEAMDYALCGVKSVIWVEALPDIYAKLKLALKRMPGQHLTFCACLSDVDDKDVTFNVASNGGQSSSFLPFGTHAKEHPTVKFTSQVNLKTKRLDTLFREFGIELSDEGWFLNADLQGVELLALRGMGEILKKFDYAYIEVNERELYKGCALAHEIDDYLGEFGFVAKETKMTGAGWGDRFYRKHL